MEDVWNWRYESNMVFRFQQAMDAREGAAMRDDKELRRAFEAWVSAPPYEREIKRWGDGAMLWPGKYYDDAVQLAWGAWQHMESERP